MLPNLEGTMYPSLYGRIALKLLVNLWHCHFPKHQDNLNNEILKFFCTPIYTHPRAPPTPPQHREANGAANSQAKWSLKSRFVSSFDLCNCPPLY